MGKVVLMMSVSLDGYIEGPGGDLGWHRVDEEVHQHFNDVLGVMGRFLHGRRMYELMADFWPTADEDPGSPPVMAEYARIWRDMPKTVYSRTLQQAGWNTTLVRAVDPAEVRLLKGSTRGDLALGGAEVGSAFLRHGLVDETRIYVHPVVVGSGTPLFAQGGPPATLELIDTRRFGNGVVLMHHAVREPVPEGTDSGPEDAQVSGR
jgi:dihydrofolate reductase